MSKIISKLIMISWLLVCQMICLLDVHAMNSEKKMHKLSNIKNVIENAKRNDKFGKLNVVNKKQNDKNIKFKLSLAQTNMKNVTENGKRNDKFGKLDVVNKKQNDKNVKFKSSLTQTEKNIKVVKFDKNILSKLGKATRTKSGRNFQFDTDYFCVSVNKDLTNDDLINIMKNSKWKMFIVDHRDGNCSCEVDGISIRLIARK